MIHDITDILPRRETPVLLYHRIAGWMVGKLAEDGSNGFPTYWCKPNGEAVELLRNDDRTIMVDRITHWTELPLEPVRR